VENVSIRFIEGESDADTLRQLYDAVIAPSFLPAEREPVEKLRRVLSADELRGAIAVMPDGVPVGALFLEWFADIRAALLCYFAVRPDLRGRGIGRRLIAVATPQWRAALKPHVVFAEAEDPHFRDAASAEHADGAASTHGGVRTDSGTGTDGGVDYGDGDARLRLYAGFGAYRLPIPYLMPELAPGAGRMPGLLLLVAEADDVVSPTPDRIRSTVVEDFLLRYFARLEGSAVGDDDSQLRQLLAECRRSDFLPLLGISGR
jgi:GNAT superfamily N-acetyltransferase